MNDELREQRVGLEVMQLKEKERMLKLFNKKMMHRMAKPKHRDVMRMQKEIKRG